MLKPAGQPDSSTTNSAAERARELLGYDPETGVLVWLVDRPGGKRAGMEAGSKNAPRGYRSVGIDGKLYLAHRLAWLLTHGVWPADEIDHINRDGLDNRLRNLRQAIHGENVLNKSMRSDNTSGVSGVSQHKRTGKWQAQIAFSGRLHYLGLFKDFASAVAVRKAAELDYFGEFAPRHR